MYDMFSSKPRINHEGQMSWIDMMPLNLNALRAHLSHIQLASSLVF